MIFYEILPYSLLEYRNFICLELDSPMAARNNYTKGGKAYKYRARNPVVKKINIRVGVLEHKSQAYTVHV